MAIVRKEVETVEHVKSVTLELSEDEARVVALAVGSVTGSSFSTWRGVADEVWCELDRLGLTLDHYFDVQDIAQGTIEAKGPLPYQPRGRV